MKSPTIRQRAWRGCVAAAVGLIVLTYSPLVLSPGNAGPWLFGLPRVLWAGFAIAALLLIVTVIGAWVHPVGEDEL